MYRIFFGVLTVLFLTIYSDHAYAARDVCNAVDSEARIGWPDGLSMSMTVDKSKKVCRFSVEGVTAGSPPQLEVFNALDIARNAVSIGNSTNSEAVAESVALLLAAASPEDTPDDELLTPEAQEGIQACIRMTALKDGPAIFFGEDYDADLSFSGARCAWVASPPDALESLNSFLKGDVTIEELFLPQLVFVNERGSLIEILFLPIGNFR